MTELAFGERKAAGEPEGLLVLHHGRGADENDLLGLSDVFDPGHRLLVVTPGGPLRVPGWQGRHWYTVPRVGFPDPETFAASSALLAELYEELWERTGLSAAQTILGGFSMGTVMSYALGLGAGRPAPAGILAFSGFIPTVEGWRAELETRRDTRVFIAHGSRDPVIDVSFARAAREELEGAGLEVSYHESEAAHHIEPRVLPAAVEWLKDTLANAGAVEGR
jgi:phospholipase/carboxylesterase